MSDTTTDVGTITRKRGRPLKNDFDKTLGIIGTITGRKTREVQEEAMRRGAEIMIAELKNNGIDILAIKANMSGKTTAA